MPSSKLMAASSPSHNERINSTVDDGGKDGDLIHPEYIAFGLVPFFFLLGLLGMFICHLLKNKGYRCTTDAEVPKVPEEEENKLEEGLDMNDIYCEGNTDTVGQIVQYIMKNEANSDALAAMIADRSAETEGVPATPTTPTTPGSPATPVSPATPTKGAKHTCSHLHTIGGAVGQNNMCNRCSHKKWPLMRRASNKLERRSHGEVTVLAVGRFRVTKTDPRPVRERCSLLVTEPNGSFPTTPVKLEASQSSGLSKADSGEKK